MPIARIRLHRHPWIDAATLAGGIVVAVLLFRLTGTRPARLPVPADTSRFVADSAFATTRVLADSFHGRVTGTLDARRAAAYLAARFNALGLVTQFQEFPIRLHGVRVRARNVVARSGGEGHEIVLVAHYDGQTTSGQSAGDNAAGVGTLLELARVIESRGHRHPIVYLATDAEEWGSLGAAEFVRSLKRTRDVLAAISLDHMASGIGWVVHLSGVGQGPGFAPLWLRLAAQDAFARGFARTTDVSPLSEWFQRTIRLSLTDQGPFVAAGIPAINLNLEARDQEYARFLYHTPGDRWATLHASSFVLLGGGTERLARALDRAEHGRGAMTYLALGAGRQVAGWAILLAAVALFVPLAFATWESWLAARADPASRAAIPAEDARAAGWWIVALVSLGALGLMVSSGLVPRYELYPATVRDPFLYSVRWVPVFATFGALALVSFALGRARRLIGLDASHSLAGRATALTTLLLLAAIAIARNPFAAVTLLVLPAWIWPWIGPTRKPLTSATGVLLVLASATPLALVAGVVARHLELGNKVGWYLFLQSAYGAWSPLTTVMVVVAVCAAWRLLGTATTRLVPASGD